MNKTIRLLLAALIASGVAACAKKVKDEPAPVTDTGTTAQPTPATDDGRFGPEDLETDSCLRQRVVYFDFDRSEIKSEFQAIMACHGKYLADRPSAAITLEGHADERGTREYNLGLGERRGNAVSGALQASGGSAGQLNVVSYGEERPTCSDSDESCWAQNRRVEIVYTAK
jgi:peptidoglycan-associated lipoprotein